MAKTNVTPQIHISLTGDFAEILDRLAERLGISKSAVIRMAVKQLHDQHFPPPPTKPN